TARPATARSRIWPGRSTTRSISFSITSEGRRHEQRTGKNQSLVQAAPLESPDVLQSPSRDATPLPGTAGVGRYGIDPGAAPGEGGRSGHRRGNPQGHGGERNFHSDGRRTQPH